MVTSPLVNKLNTMLHVQYIHYIYIYLYIYYIYIYIYILYIFIYSVYIFIIFIYIYIKIEEKEDVISYWMDLRKRDNTRN